LGGTAAPSPFKEMEFRALSPANSECRLFEMGLILRRIAAIICHPVIPGATEISPRESWTMLGILFDLVRGSTTLTSPDANLSVV